MQPTKLVIKDFLSYGDVDLDLSQISIAALLGHNGAGKSSMLDSLTWSLYGEGRYKDIDRYIRQGQEQATVEQHFSLNGDTYRIIRGRSNKGKGKTTLEFARQNGAGWIPLSGDTIRETQQKIRDILRMDYDTFVSSCFILQGQSDKFCSAGPTDRKRILGQILGLDIYDRLHEDAKARVKEYAGKIDAARSKIDAIDQELSGRAEIRSSEATTRESVQSISQKIKDTEEDLQAKEEEKGKLQLQIAKLDGLRDQKASLEKEILEIDTFMLTVEEKEKDAGRRADIGKQLNDISIVLKGREEAIEEQQDLLARAERDAQMAVELWKKHNQLNEEIERAEKQLKALEEKRKRYSQILERREEITAKAEELERVKADLSDLDRKSSEYMKMSKEAEQLERLASNWDKENETQISGIQATLESKRPLAETMKDVPCSGSAKDTCKLLANARDAVEDIAILEKRLKKLNENKNPHVELWQNSAKTRDNLQYDAEVHQGLRLKVPELEKWARYVPEIKQAEEGLREIDVQVNELQEDTYGKTRKKEQVLEQINTLESTVNPAEKKQQIEQLKEGLLSFRQTEQVLRTDYGQAEAAEKQLAEMKTKAEGKKQDRQQKQQILKDIIDRIAGEAEIKSKLERIYGELSDIKSKLTQSREEEQVLKIDLGKLQQKLEDLAAKEQEKKTMEAQIKEDAREEHYYSHLVKAFGRNGIPALIVESSVPDIEALANNLLSRLSGGRMSVRMETQREAKSTGNVSEALDIFISDELGERPYEGWSGAERFETDLALSLAIAKFLAQRAGTKIETLVCDENASCLDMEGRQRFVEVINEIAEDFKKVIVITHISELQEAFPQQIVVKKTPEGSSVEVLA